MRWGASLPSGEKQLGVIGIASAQIPSVGLKRAAPGNILVDKKEKCSCQASRPQTIVSFLSAHPQVEVSLNIVAIAPGLRVRFQRVIAHCRQAQQSGKRPRAASLSDWFRNGLPRERKVVLQPNGFVRDNPKGTQQPFLCRHIHLLPPFRLRGILPIAPNCG